MKRIYLKNELAFSLIWIGIYVVSFSLADSFSSTIGIEKSLTALLAIIMTLFLYLWINKMNLKSKYGLVYPSVSAGRLFYYVPLIMIVSVNLWSGIQLNYSVIESVLFVISMAGVGFLEEIIFRGFLFKALCKDGLKQAILISSMTFGIGHIINLFTGAELFSTLLQIAYAISIGYLFTILFLCTDSLIPCILTHSAVNSLSCFISEQSIMLEIVSSIFLIIVPLVYAYAIQKKRP